MALARLFPVLVLPSARTQPPDALLLVLLPPMRTAVALTES
jgi:hypothetical protein